MRCNVMQQQASKLCEIPPSMATVPPPTMCMEIAECVSLPSVSFSVPASGSIRRRRSSDGFRFSHRIHGCIVPGRQDTWEDWRSATRRTPGRGLTSAPSAARRRKRKPSDFSHCSSVRLSILKHILGTTRRSVNQLITSSASANSRQMQLRSAVCVSAKVCGAVCGVRPPKCASRQSTAKARPLDST